MTMKTVLLVEDEKLIRQGLRTMIQRSGVPVEVIIECSNGEMALEVLKEQNVDVMFTDIRMPKMDGIELVKQMQNLPHIPLTVAVSGYDDFSYAVEMMRGGVREYILKPIEREKIKEILEKFEKELSEKQASDRNRKKFGYQQIKHMMLSESTTEEEFETLEQQYEREFYDKNYVVCCVNSGKTSVPENEQIVALREVEGNDIFLMREEMLPLFKKNLVQPAYLGISRVHRGIRELRSAYLESLHMRKEAFCRNKFFVEVEEEEHIPEKLIEEAKKLLDESAGLRRVQILGTDRREEMIKLWEQLFYETENGRISAEEFENCMREFFAETEKIYRNVVEMERETFEHLCWIFAEDCLNDYSVKLKDYLLWLQEAIGSQFDGNRNKQKMKQAVEYIEAHYNEDLNMAVVSNQISMNYSLFSYSFKQYTGSNFVNFIKDIRMREAKRLLAETDLRVNEISQEIGYENEKHFMKIFKASCGVSPSEYRKNMQQNA